MKKRVLCASYYYYLTIFLYGGSAYGCNGNGTVLVDEMCIFYDPTNTTWFEAKKTCAKHGMHLATVQSPEQVLRMISILPPNTKLNAWVGANDVDHEGHFIWDEDHRPVVENVWKNAELNHLHGNKDCTFVDHGRLITDVNCSDEKPALCMYRLPTPPNFFGPNNTYICHCAEGTCLSDGTCTGANVRCSKEWFGPNCQFRSLSGDKYGPLGVLADNDDNTCTSTTIQPITVKLKAGSIFTWIRIIVEKPEHLGGFELYFYAFGVKVACQEMCNLTVDHRSADIICPEGPFIVDDLVLSWSGAKSLCSLYINGEQNFALLEDTSPGDDVAMDNSSSLPVDGRRSPTDRCFTGLPKVGKQQWTLTFKKPKVINEIIIYRKPRIDGYSFMNGFHMSGFDRNGVVLFHYNDTGMNANKSAVWFITDIKIPMNRIEIVLDNANLTRYMELCEVETFGVCGPPDYGLFCDKTCDSTCRGQVCHVSGACAACAYGQSADGECLSAEGSAPTVSPNMTSTSTNASGVTRTKETVTEVPLPLCTTPELQANENHRRLQYLVLGNLHLALLVAVLIIYIVYTRKETSPSTVGSPVQEPILILEETPSPGDLIPVKSEHSHKSDVSVHYYKIEKSNVTLKLIRSNSTHIT